MSKRPHPLKINPISPGARVRVTCGRHAGEEGVVAEVFLRAGVSQSHVHVSGLPSCEWCVASVPLSCVEVAQ